MNLSMHRAITSEEMIEPQYVAGKGVDRYSSVKTLPCHGCDSKESCAANQTACAAYKHYCANKYAKAEVIDSLSRTPTELIFQKIDRGEG